MELKLIRKYLKDDYTIGHLYINGEYFSDVIEDKVRDLDKEQKVYGKTSIPYGRYDITLKVQSPKFSKYSFYKEVCNGYLPRLLDVPHFEGILIHVADGHKGAELVQGCLGVGYNKIKGGLLDGKQVFVKLYNILRRASDNGEQIWITIE